MARMQSAALLRSGTLPGQLGSGGVPSPGGFGLLHPIAAAFQWLRGCCEPRYLLMASVLLAILTLQVRPSSSLLYSPLQQSFSMMLAG